MKKYSIFYLFLLFLSGACSKGSGKEKDSVNPVITLNTPTDNQVFTGGQNIVISGNVTDNKYIEEIHIEITNLVTAQEYLHVHIHPNAGTFNFNQTFAAQAGISYRIRVIADDAATNSIAKIISVSCN